MKPATCTKILKWLSFFLCIIVMLYAISEIIFIVHVSKVLTTQTVVGMTLIIILSLFVAILGCCGALKESGMLMIICGISSFVASIYYVVTLWFIIDIDGDKVLAKSYVEEKWAEQIKDPDSMEDLEKLFKCCGKDSADDYENVLHRHIPKSCYSNSDELYKDGCLSATEELVVDNSKVKFRIFLYFIKLCVIALLLEWFFIKKPFEQYGIEQN